MNLKRYKAKLRKNTDVNTFSLVLGAAVETVLSKFSAENEKPVFFANEEKRIIYSVAMRPDKDIYRKNINGEPALVYFDSEEIEQIQQSYFRNNNKGLVKMNINHSDEVVDGVYPIESWIVDNPDLDKSKTLMMQDVRKGDLIIGYKIDNNDVWENFVKTGEVDGLSVEAFLDYEINDKVNMKDDEKKSLFAEFKSWFAAEPVVQPADAKPVDAKPADAPADPMKAMQDQIDALTKSVEEIKQKLSDDEAAEVQEDAQDSLATMKAEKEKAEADKVKAETELATFKAEQAAIVNLPNDKPLDKMTPLEKFRASKNN